LKTFLQAGVAIRENNLQLAQNNAASVRTLTQLEQQQVKDLALVNRLSGQPATDLPLLTQLQTALQSSIKAVGGASPAAPVRLNHSCTMHPDTNIRSLTQTQRHRVVQRQRRHKHLRLQRHLRMQLLQITVRRQHQKEQTQELQRLLLPMRARLF
jgi:hypothetical protein